MSDETPQQLLDTKDCEQKPKVEEIVFLTEKQDAFLEFDVLPSDLDSYARDNFGKIFSLHPKERGTIAMMGKDLVSPRWHKSYLSTPKFSGKFAYKSYMFSNSVENDVNGPLPDLLQPFLYYMNGMGYEFNQVVVNWYADGLDFIAAHSDCEVGIDKDCPIAIISLGGDLGEELRILKFKPKATTKDSIYDLVEFPCKHGSIVFMHGSTQEKFRHGVPKASHKSAASRRISITFRKYKEAE